MLAALLVPTMLLGQSDEIKVENRVITDHWVIDPAQFDNDLELSVRSIAAPFPGGEGERQELIELKRKSAQLYPRKYQSTASTGIRGLGDTLAVIDSFAVRFFLNDYILQGGTPNDNTMAISNDGKLVASFNSQVWGYDMENDTFLFKSNNPHPSFNQFIGSYTNSGMSISSSAFDPKLFYDPGRDRFVFLFLTDGQDTLNSSTVICFSTTNDPSRPWHAYRLEGNPFKDGTWTDYPQIACNEHSLYLTLNQLSGPSWVADFDQTIIWQLDLDAAYSGDTALPSRIYSNIKYGGESLRYLRPVKTAFGPQGDTMLFISNRPRAISNDSIWLLQVSGSVDEPMEDPSMTLMTSDVDYGIPPYAQQAEGHTFWTNDARPLGAVRVQNEVHFVGNTINHETGLAAIFHGVIEDIEQPTVRGHIISDDTIEFGFANIEFMGLTALDRDMVINFNHTSPNHPAGNAAVYYSNEREYGPVQLLVEGTTHVDMISQSFDVNERWGDYIGLQRRFNATARVWAAGYVSYGNKRAGTWVSELATPRDFIVGMAEARDQGSTMIFPNPAANWVQLKCESTQWENSRIVIYDMSGRVVRNMGQHRLRPGANLVTMNIASLPAGSYVVRVEQSGGQVMAEKLVKN